MTPTELAKLTPEEKRVKIAEACGVKPLKRWRVFYDKDRQHGTVAMLTREDAEASARNAAEFWESLGHSVSEFSEPEEYDEWYWAPNYLNDLNAMRDAIMSQTPEFRKAMRNYLWKMMDQMSAHFADAATMADAFLLTLK